MLGRKHPASMTSGKWKFLQLSTIWALMWQTQEQVGLEADWESMTLLSSELSSTGGCCNCVSIAKLHSAPLQVKVTANIQISPNSKRCS